MKRILIIFMTIVSVCVCVSCDTETVVVPLDMKPEITQMKAICELAVMECYYHNVAKYFDEKAVKGFLGIGSKDKKFWVEYSGVVKIGIDISLVTFNINDNDITIALPPATVLGCKVDSSSLTKDSYIVDKKSADIVAEDEVKALNEAQQKMEETALSNKALLASAQQQAQKLLSEYIHNIGNAVGKQYTIKWIYVDESGNPYKTTEEKTTQSPETTTTEQTAA